MAKIGKKKLSHNKNDKQKFKGQKRKRFDRDIRPMKKRKMEGSQDKVLTKKQLKKKFFSARQYEVKEFEARKITDEGILRKMDVEDEEEVDNPYNEFVNMFGVRRNVSGESDDDDCVKEEECEEDESEDQDDVEEEKEGMDGASHVNTGEARGEEEDDDEDNDDDDDNDDVESEEEEQVCAAKDPYKEHYGPTLDVKVAVSLMKPSKWNVEKVQIPLFGEATVMYPPVLAAPSFQFGDVDLKKSCIKAHIVNQFKSLQQQFPSFSAKSSGLSDVQENLFPIINSYTDLYFPSRTFKNGDDLMFLYCLHALNHVTKIRNIVIKNNTKIKEKIEKLKKKKKKNKDDDDDRDIQDQGYARPKVLIIVPFRSCVLKIVNILIHLLEKAHSSEKTMVSKKIRFMEEFGSPEEPQKGLKPDDFEQTFVGNTDENFKIGISIAKKTLKLYNEFYSSDIVIASPLGLKEVVEPEEKGKKKAGDHMFLSSIEVLIIDQSDVLLMQNWNNVITVLNHLNKQPDGKFAADIARIKDWYINGWQSLYRQTLIFSSFQTPEINGVFQKFASNYKGKCIIPASISRPTMCNILSSLPQTFRRFNIKSIEDVAEARFQFFIKRVLPAFRNSSEEHIIIFIPSYYDFIRIRKYMKKEELQFEEICEYTTKERVSRARQFFFEGRMKYLLFTERFHYYYRYFIRGIHHLIFYELPINAQFYPELCNMVVDYKKEIVPVNTSCSVLYSRYDVQKLMRIAGSERTNTLITSDEDTFSFASVDS